MTREELLDFMRQKTYKPLTAEELSRSLSANRAEEYEGLLLLLEELEREGAVILTRKKKYGLPELMGLVVGRLAGHSQGYGFVIPDKPGEVDIHIASESMNGALHRDRVIVRLLPSFREGGRREGEVIRILEPGYKMLVGTLERTGRYAFVLADETKIKQDVFVAGPNLGGAKNGDKVVVEITARPLRGRSPEGKVLEVLGRPDQPGIDVLSIVRKYDLPEQFPSDVLREAEEIPSIITPDDLEGRRDFRAVRTVTIDGPDAKDLDDAISIQLLPNGNFYLSVHIADVGYYVPEGSKLDQEAFRRGTSVYLVDRVIPMLPSRLSNGICSLNAGEDRLTISASMEVDNKGRVLRYDINPAVIRIDERLTYDVVRSILDEGDADVVARYAPLVNDLKLMQALSEILRRRRIERGALDFDFPESKVILDEHGRPEEIVRLERGVGEFLIEDFMILANTVIARYMYNAGVPFVYRIHEQPDPDRIQELNLFLGTLGYRVRASNKKYSSRSFQQVLARAAGKPEERVINTAILRSTKHARYATECQGHFGLAEEFYCHFTSPIRRYPDLAIHRTIREYLSKQRLSSRREADLRRLTSQYAQQSSEREKVAEEAERESVDLKKVQYMERHLGQVFTGVISSVMPFGMFVELESTVEGLVHVSSMADDYYQFIETDLALLGRHTKKRYRVGDLVQVRVTRVDTASRQVDFELVAAECKNRPVFKNGSQLEKPPDKGLDYQREEGTHTALL